MLVAVYGVFAISASARALFQLVTEFSEAPIAYSLSLVSAAVYVVATIALARSSEVGKRVAWIAVWFELFGVVAVGVASLMLPDLFAHPSVWSGFGSGYGYVPLFLPVLGLLWLRGRHARAS